MTRQTKGRPYIVQTTLNDAEMTALRQQADREGVTITAFLRQLVIRNTPVRLVELKTPETPAGSDSDE